MSPSPLLHLFSQLQLLALLLLQLGHKQGLLLRRHLLKLVVSVGI